VRVADFDFELPERCIASAPVEPRDAARLLVYERASAARWHVFVRDLPRFLRPGDLLVLNDTKVVPCRLLGARAGGGRVEVLIVERRGGDCVGYVKPARKIRAGQPIALEGGALTMLPQEDLGGGRWRFALPASDLEAVLERVGRAPLPPYIRRDGSEDVVRDRAAYQTVFAAVPGAIAAPTAGLHFTPELLEMLRVHGVAIARVTLHVGEGTFAPVRVDAVAEHRMHEEEFELPPATAELIARTRAAGGRIVAVGTTSARTLESCALPDRSVRAQRGRTALFLHPGRPLRVVDALLTNFHLPRSTLLMLVSAFAGRERILELYAEAIDSGYRFYSFGDAMLLL
jgi:S-adenosylmethionine:tRNA ribosyltransferase-isomerase